MKVGILGTGMVGRIHAEKLASLGHDVMIGTQDVAVTLAKAEADRWGSLPFGSWLKEHPLVKLDSMPAAASHGELVINALNAKACPGALKVLAAELKGKDLIDISNPLDFSKGMPPSLFVCNTDSLAEQIQKAIPETRVVKALNTSNAILMVNPAALAGAEHSTFVSGNDLASKTRVISYLKNWYGWKDVIDLGDIATARGTEMLIPVWLSLRGAFQTPLFNFKVVRG